MNFIKNHWFGVFISILLLWLLLVFTLILISPRQDKQKRGFILCTEKMADEMLVCEDNKIYCMIEAIVENSYCDMTVVVSGFSSWMQDKQEYPWSNYIFEPELSDDGYEFDAEAKAKYYGENSDMKIEMKELKQLSEGIENEQLPETK